MTSGRLTLSAVVIYRKIAPGSETVSNGFVIPLYMDFIIIIKILYSIEIDIIDKYEIDLPLVIFYIGIYIDVII